MTTTDTSGAVLHGCAEGRRADRLACVRRLIVLTLLAFGLVAEAYAVVEIDAVPDYLTYLAVFGLGAVAAGVYDVARDLVWTWRAPCDCAAFTDEARRF